MKMRLVTLAVVFTCLLNGCASVPASKRLVDDYHYSYNEPPSICFFPKGQAKWDGYKITNKNWNKLDGYLKIMFIYEAVQESQRKNQVSIVLRDSSRALKAIDYGIAKMNRDVPQEQILVVDFMYDVFKEAKMVTPAKTGVTRK